MLKMARQCAQFLFLALLAAGQIQAQDQATVPAEEKKAPAPTTPVSGQAWAKVSVVPGRFVTA